MRDFITLIESETTPVGAFLRDFYEASYENPFAPRIRVLGQAMLELSPSVNDRATAIHISDIRSLEKGGGTAAMTTLCDLADKHGVTLEAIAKAYDDHHDITTPDLLRWYTKLGFKNLGGDDDEGYEIERKPKKPLALGSGMRTVKLRGFKRPH